jgi:hypothetical protein
VTVAAPQIIWLALLTVCLLFSAANNTIKGNVPGFVIDVVLYGASFGLLYWGGFFAGCSL